MYDVVPQIAEIYDQHETYADDLQLILHLIGGLEALHILEPFCGTGRLLIPLACASHTLVGMDIAAGMLARARMKIGFLPKEVQERITLKETDVLTAGWPGGFNLVVLGGNCFYELATPEEQEACIRKACAALEPGGYVYVDNNHMEGGLDPSWQVPGRHPGFPSGLCQDGTAIASFTETIWVDVQARLARFRRSTYVTYPDGSSVEKEYVQQKHPISKGEVQAWLEKYGFSVEHLYGDRAGNPYTEESGRAIFWARKI